MVESVVRLSYVLVSAGSDPAVTSPARHVGAFAAYAVLALALLWPLPPSGDTGVYVWNLWVFHHEAMAGRFPWSTDRIFAATGPADLSLHNYTTLANLVAYPLVDPLGVVVTFNLVMFLWLALDGYALFLLARYAGACDIDAWLAGAAFAASPVIIARTTAHASLVAAGPLVLFTLFLLRALDRRHVRDAIGMGVMAALAAFSDAYFAVYAVVITLTVLAVRQFGLTSAESPSWRPRGALWAIDLLIVCTLGIVAAIVVRGGSRYELLGMRVNLVRLYTPMLVFTVLCVVRLLVVLRPRLRVAEDAGWASILRVGTLAVVMAMLLLSPILVAVGQRMKEGRLDSTKTLWRSSPPGVDLAAFFLPNPNHAWVREWSTPFLTAERADGFAEFTASLSLVALAVILVAWRATRWRVPRLWAVLAVLFGALALGPFVHVDGINTYVPGPWALLRYVPLVGLARSPSRFTIVAWMAFAVLFALALGRFRERWPARAGTIVACVAVLMAFELNPMPRVLAAANIPEFFSTVAADRDARVRVLELPVGLRDGTSSMGNFSARTLFHQTAHRKAVLGGYLSRISESRKQQSRKDALMQVLFTLSEGLPLTDEARARAMTERARVVARLRVGYVVVDRMATPPQLQAFATEYFDLVSVAEDERYSLYRARSYAPGPAPPPSRSDR
jgi:hypothetical protein